MTIINPDSPKRSHEYTPLLRKDIETAQQHTNSNRQAAKWLGVGYGRYKKYAQLYGLYDRHNNPHGIGSAKGFAMRPTSIPLREILNNQHPTYSISKLKNRLIARKKLDERCNLCGFEERRFTDKKMPLILNFKDGNRQNMHLENLEVLCYNCTFLTTSARGVQYKHGMEKTLRGIPMKNYRAYDREPTRADGMERTIDLLEAEVPHGTLTDAERAQLLDELAREHD
jgi:hypothetical protein